MKVTGWILMTVTVVAVTLAGVVGCERADSGSSSSSSGMSISPTTINIAASASTNLAFTVSGGTPGYTWVVNTSDLGTIVGAGATAIYTSKTNAGLNIITVTDSMTNSVAATITQI